MKTFAIVLSGVAVLMSMGSEAHAQSCDRRGYAPPQVQFVPAPAPAPVVVPPAPQFVPVQAFVPPAHHPQFQPPVQQAPVQWAPPDHGGWGRGGMNPWERQAMMQRRWQMEQMRRAHHADGVVTPWEAARMHQARREARMQAWHFRNNWR